MTLSLGLVLVLQAAPHSLLAPSLVGDAEFGAEIVTDGTQVLVAAPDDGDGCNPTGSVHRFERVAQGWSGAESWAEAPCTSPQLGEALAVDGDTLVIGTGRFARFARVFERSGGAWTLATELDANHLPASENLSFGQRLALDGSTLLVGSLYNAPGVAEGVQAHVFERTGGGWTHVADLRPAGSGSPVPVLDWSGSRIALEGDRAVISGQAPDGSKGLVVTFHRSTGGWVEESTLESPNQSGPFSDGFGSGGLELEGGRLVVGATADSAASHLAGAVRVFEHDGSGWIPLQTLRVASSRLYGSAIDAHAGRLIIAGSRVQDIGLAISVPAVDVYELEASSGLFERTHRFADPYPASTTGFGASVAIHGDTVAVGADRALSGGGPFGAAYVTNLKNGWDRAGERFCRGAACPCPATGSDVEGCQNSRYEHATLAANGSPSITTDTLELTGARLVPGVVAMVFAAPAEGAPRPFGAGTLCLGSHVALAARTTDANGWFLEPSGIASRLNASGAALQPGETWAFQLVYREPMVRYGCLSIPQGIGNALPITSDGPFNATSGVRVTFRP